MTLQMESNFRKHWAQVRPGLMEILQDSSHELILPEDIYAALCQRDAFLFVASDGWCILRDYYDPTTQVKSLLIWYAWCNGGRAIERYLPEIECLAREVKVSQMTFTATRPGYERALPPGWYIQHVRYTKNLTPISGAS